MQPVPKKPQFKLPSLSACFNKAGFFVNPFPPTWQPESWVRADLSLPWQSLGSLPPSQSGRATLHPQRSYCSRGWWGITTREERIRTSPLHLSAVERKRQLGEKEVVHEVSPPQLQ